jgi:hypothetical protein
MGQYYKIVNLTKNEFLDPSVFGEGLKLLEFGCDSNGVLTALAVLLANSNDRGGGDLHGVPEDFPIQAGRWAGNEIVVAGDYAKDGDKGERGKFPGRVNLYDTCNAGFLRDISLEAIALIEVDRHIARDRNPATGDDGE